MNRREIKPVEAACAVLMESACLLKMELPILARGPLPDWPMLTHRVQQLQRQLGVISALLPETGPVGQDDLQWRLVEHALPDDDLLVMVSIENEDDAQLGFIDRSGEEIVWRYQDAMQISGKVYAWSDVPASLNARRTAQHLLTFPTGGAS